jgi:hypothetical protein
VIPTEHSTSISCQIKIENRQIRVALGLLVLDSRPWLVLKLGDELGNQMLLDERYIERSQKGAEPPYQYLRQIEIRQIL